MVHCFRTIRSILCLACSLGPGYLSVRAWAEETQARDWHQLVRPFLHTYCLDCHSGSGAEAGIDFEIYQTDELLPQQRSRWNQIRGMIEIGAMPPADHQPRPRLMFGGKLPSGSIAESIESTVISRAMRVA